MGQLAVSLVIAALILGFTLWASGWAAGLVRRALGQLQRPGAPDATLQGFMASLVRWVIIVVGLMAVLEQLGVRATSILAVLGVASLAIGLALQGALSNVAAGVMILILRPYRVGHVVEINGKVGTVKRLDLFMTELSDPDNLDIFMPNGKVFGDTIINYSSPANRRMELGGGGRHRNLQRIVQHLAGQLANVGGHGGGEEQRLPLFRQVTQDLPGSAR